MDIENREVNPSGSSPHRPRLAQRLAYADAFEMKHQGRASLSGIVVVELVSGRRVVVSPDDLPRLGALPPIASVRLASFKVFCAANQSPKALLLRGSKVEQLFEAK